MRDKVDLRKEIRAAILQRSQAALLEAARAIRETVTELPEWRAARVIGSFASQPVEPFVDPLLEVARAERKRIAYPRVTPDGLALVEVDSLADLAEEERWKLREPAGDHLQMVEPHEIGLLLVPGVAFDRDRNRLGRGGGYYDRLLQMVPLPVRCGVCFDLQVVARVPAEPHDQPVGMIVTEAGRL